MADEKQVNIIIKSKYEGQGDVNAKKGLEKVEEQAKRTKESMKDVHGAPCEVYSRVVGYLRPVQSWNKRQERRICVA